LYTALQKQAIEGLMG